jgi:uncharacterized cofD-like protein
MFIKWLTIGIGVKRWLLVLIAGIFLVSIGFAFGIANSSSNNLLATNDLGWGRIIASVLSGIIMAVYALIKLSRNLLAPYRRHQHGRIIDVVYAHSKRHKGVRVVAIGGGTGLPSVLRGMKVYTSNITAIVTVADDGGSSGRLRREMGVLPPGDMRNNIAALADDEELMTQLFQHRFNNGALGGHPFGNLFIAALAGISGGIETALPEVERILNIQGRVLPSTLEDVNLIASVQLPGRSRITRIKGETKIGKSNGRIDNVNLLPNNVAAYDESIRAILEAELIVIGPGSLYTSIIPNLLVNGVSDALQTSTARKVYVCNVATQPGETVGYDVADHILGLEKHIGRNIFQVVIANNNMPTLNAGSNTHYVRTSSPNNDIMRSYEVRYTDLVDTERPWRHDPHKLAQELLKLIDEEIVGDVMPTIENL